MPELENKALALEEIRRWVRSTLGIEFPDEKLDSLKRRLDDVISAERIEGYTELIRRLQATPSSPLHIKVSQAMTTNHTAFFRERETLDALFDIEPPSDGPLRVWCAACATGQEPYSLAILACEHFGVDAGRRFALLATDISDRAIQTAAKGQYRPAAIAALSAQHKATYFEERGDVFDARDALKSLCTFRRLNLAAASWPFKRDFHAVYCRNVLYYFDVSLQKRIVDRIYQRVAPGGWLFTSVTESLRGLDTQWQYVRPGVYRKDKR